MTCLTPLHPGGILPHKKDGGSRWKFWKEPLWSTKIMLCGHGLKVFHLLEEPFLKQNIISCHICFRLNTLKVTSKAPPCGPFEAQHSKRYQNHPPPPHLFFYMKTINFLSEKTDRSGPHQKVDRFFRNFSGWDEPIHSVLDRNFRKFWRNESRHRESEWVSKIQIRVNFWTQWTGSAEFIILWPLLDVIKSILALSLGVWTDKQWDKQQIAAAVC